MKQITFALLFFIVSPVFAYAANIDATDKYARFLNTGTLINFGATNGYVTVTNTAVTGNAWSSAVGWINLAPTNGGVVNDGHGILSGYAWGENTGWINFKPTNGGVTIDSSGNFNGYAWSESRGWIVFNCETDSSCGTLSHKVKTTWIPPTTTTTTGSLGSGWVNTVNSQIPQPVSSTPSEPSTPIALDNTETETPPFQIPEQPSSTTPAQTPSASQTETIQPTTAPVSSGVASEGQATVGEVNSTTDSAQPPSPATQGSIFSFTSKVTSGVSRLFSSAKDFFVNGKEKSGGAPSSSVLGSVTVLSVVITGVVAFILLFILSRTKSILIKSFSVLLAGASSWWMALVAHLAVKRRTAEKPIETVNKEEVTPVITVPEIPVIPITEVKKEEETISWNIQPQPVVLPTKNMQDNLQELGIEIMKEESTLPFSGNIKKEVAPIVVIKKEEISNTNKQSSEQDFMKLFVDRNPLNPELLVEKVSNSPKEEVGGVVLPEPQKEIEESPEILPTLAAEEPIESLIHDEPIPQNIPNSSPATVPVVENTVIEKNEKPQQKITEKIEGRFEQFLRIITKKLRRVAKEVKPVDKTKKHIWNPRPPTGTD